MKLKKKDYIEGINYDEQTIQISIFEDGIWTHKVVEFNTTLYRKKWFKKIYNGLREELYNTLITKSFIRINNYDIVLRDGEIIITNAHDSGNMLHCVFCVKDLNDRMLSEATAGLSYGYLFITTLIVLIDEIKESNKLWKN